MFCRLSQWSRFAAFSLSALLAASGARAQSGCPGDVNGDARVTIDEVVHTVDAALHGCSAVPVTGPRLLATGQTQCDQGNGQLGPCPGVPSGQDGMVGAGVRPSYTDNGDGTITDHATGLMWEKLSHDDSIHSWKTTYHWSEAVNEKMVALNTHPCFADHCDWRLPNRRELESLVNVGVWGPAVASPFYKDCPDPDAEDEFCTVLTCSCTQSGLYWSSTSYQSASTLGVAWLVDFNQGLVNAAEKTLEMRVYYARAVRGGL